MTIVYTAILGHSDSLKPAPTGADVCACYTDPEGWQPFVNGWMCIPRFYAGDPRREAWRLRCVPDELFNSYDRVVWVDASFTLTDLPRLLRDAGSAPIAALRHHERKTPYQEAARLAAIGQADKADVTRQVSQYQSERFNPRHLSISCILVRDGSAAVQQFNQTWLDEITTHPGDNTQVSLDYSAWKPGLSIKALRGTRHRNPYATHDHLDHKRRRRPYATAVAV